MPLLSPLYPLFLTISSRSFRYSVLADSALRFFSIRAQPLPSVQRDEVRGLCSRTRRDHPVTSTPDERTSKLLVDSDGVLEH